MFHSKHFYLHSQLEKYFLLLGNNCLMKQKIYLSENSTIAQVCGYKARSFKHTDLVLSEPMLQFWQRRYQAKGLLKSEIIQNNYRTHYKSFILNTYSLLLIETERKASELLQSKICTKYQTGHPESKGQKGYKFQNILFSKNLKQCKCFQSKLLLITENENKVSKI